MPSFPKAPPSKTEEGCKDPPGCSVMQKLNVRGDSTTKIEAHRM